MKIGDLVKPKKDFIKRNTPFFDEYEEKIGILIYSKFILNSKLYSIYFGGKNLLKVYYFWEYEIEEI